MQNNGLKRYLIAALVGLIGYSFYTMIFADKASSSLLGSLWWISWIPGFQQAETAIDTGAAFIVALLAVIIIYFIFWRKNKQ